jgi:4-hydroxyphenylacetate 3-monooxygenase
MLQRWAEATFGLMGRTPDHVAGFFAGFAARPAFFATAGQQFADNLTAFYEYARDNHLYISYALVPPQIDRSKPSHRQADPTLCAGVVQERDGGIVLRGAQQLATGAAFSDYLFLSCIHPLVPGDENHAISVAMPINAPGLKVYARRSYATNATSTFDYPLSSRFDETDALITLDDVFVPWERVFIYRNLELCRDQWTKTPSHVYGNYQAQIRYATKLRFLLGVMKYHCEITGVDSIPLSQAQLGEMAALASIVEIMVEAQESRATVDEDGVVWPSRIALYSVMALQSDLNPKLMDIARDLSGGAMIMLPSSHLDYENPETAKDLERYVASPGYPSRSRVALLKLAWDLIGSEFAGRHQQYEKFYGVLHSLTSCTRTGITTSQRPNGSPRRRWFGKKQHIACFSHADVECQVPPKLTVSSRRSMTKIRGPPFAGIRTGQVASAAGQAYPCRGHRRPHGRSSGRGSEP